MVQSKLQTCAVGCVNRVHGLLEQGTERKEVSKRGREGGRNREREGGREGEIERGREGGREGGREEEIEGGREGGRRNRGREK